MTTTVTRQIVHIDEELCNGCGVCVSPCAEGAIVLIDGKARVVKEELCDGAGFCLGVCPTGALKPKREWLLENGEKMDEIIAATRDDRKTRKRGSRLK